MLLFYFELLQVNVEQIRAAHHELFTSLEKVINSSTDPETQTLLPQDDDAGVSPEDKSIEIAAEKEDESRYENDTVYPVTSECTYAAL